MGEAARKMTVADEELLGSIQPPERYVNGEDAAAIRALKNLPEDKQLKVLRALGVNPENPLSVSGDFRSSLLDAVATIGFGVNSTGKGSNPMHVSTPTGGAGKKSAK